MSKVSSIDFNNIEIELKKKEKCMHEASFQLLRLICVQKTLIFKHKKSNNYKNNSFVYLFRLQDTSSYSESS